MHAIHDDVFPGNTINYGPCRIAKKLLPIAWQELNFVDGIFPCRTVAQHAPVRDACRWHGFEGDSSSCYQRPGRG
jgi:hypothetical protein